LLYRSLIFFSVLFNSLIIVPQSYITTEQYGGRFGDQLLLYCFGKFCAKHLNMPFVFRPFPNSELLKLYEAETHFKQQPYKQKKILRFNKGDKITIMPDTLYEVPFWAPSHFLKEVAKDKELTTHLRQMIKPRNKIKEFSLPSDKLTVAVHVRKGGGFDRPLLSRQRYTKDELEQSKMLGKRCAFGNYQDVMNAPKFPPDQFYIDQIIYVSESLNNRPLYVFIFTDDQNPKKIMQEYKEAINRDNIIFDCRQEKNHHTMNIVEDMMAMAKFDYLIRPESAFSIIAQIIGNHKMIIHPAKINWYGHILHVEEVERIVGSNIN
jgi:hypothetical protein